METAIIDFLLKAGPAGVIAAFLFYERIRGSRVSPASYSGDLSELKELVKELIHIQRDVHMFLQIQNALIKGK